MKKGKIKIKTLENMKKYRIATIIAAIILILICSVPIAAYAEDWIGWTEDKIEEAWAVYIATDWSNISSLNFSVGTDGSIASANVPDNFRTQYESVIDEVLGSSPYATVFSDPNDTTNKTAYKELLLAIAYTLNAEGNSIWENGFETEETDVCFIGKYINNTVTISSVKSSFEVLFSRLILSEQVYCRNHLAGAQMYSIYSNNEYLAAVIQGVVYGPGYVTENETYTSANAKEYYNSNTGIPKKWNSFADEVASRYSAVKSTADHAIVG